MGPPGLIISKLGVQATASSDTVRGLLCLKVSLPREGEGRQAARWGLFSTTPPKLLSTPTVHPLPLPIHSSISTPATLAKCLRTAATLLSIAPPTSYPPSSPSGPGTKPFLDISSTTRQVYLVVDPVSGPRRNLKKSEGGARRDWLVIMEFEVKVEQMENALSKALIPLPKCLDNVIRFQILAPQASSSSNPIGEVSILTEPKMLSLPASTFASSSRDKGEQKTVHSGESSRKRKEGLFGADEGWEDGEDLGPDDHESEDSDGEIEAGDWSDDSDEVGGSWLEGRFQSTDSLRLDWSFNGPSSTLPPPSLHISPIWDKRQPAIHLSYEAVLPSEDRVVSLEVIAPDGWGWRQLDIQGDGLTGWRSVDGNWWDVNVVPAEDDMSADLTLNESFSTIRNRFRPTLSAYPVPTPSQSSASLMRQTLPAPMDMKVEDYSFELNGPEANSPPALSTPTRRRPATPLARELVKREDTSYRDPLPGSLFDLYFNESTERAVILEGTLVPLSSLTLVSPSAPLPIPFIRIDGPTSRSRPTHVSCPTARYTGDSSIDPAQHLCDTSCSTVGSLHWTDSVGQAIPTRKSVGIRGIVRVKLQRNSWGLQTISMLVPWPKGASEIVFTTPTGALALTRATMRGIPLARSMTEVNGQMEVRVGCAGNEGQGTAAEVVLEIAEEDGQVVLPHFKDASGTMNVELRGEGWDDVKGNFRRNPGTPFYTFHLSSSVPPTLSFAQRSPMSVSATGKTKARTLLSFSTFINLFMLWLLVSMGQQVQRLRQEVAFVADEARDLRLYGFANHQPMPVEIVEEPELPPGPIIIPDGGDETRSLANTESRVSMALGRVVLGSTVWDRLTVHPTVQTLRTGVSWLWQTVVWLVR